ncbi:MAG: PepSY-associated TM helix domain-containing protein [Pseudomonadota bacterium]
MKIWLRVHKWSSLLSTLFLLLLCLTGLPLIFSDELSSRPTPARTKYSQTAAPDYALDQAVRAQSAASERKFVQFVFWQEDDPTVIGLGVANVPDAPLEDVKRLLVDANTGQPRGEIPPESRVLTTILDLHRNLCVGSVGDVLLALVALLFVASTVSGAVIYGPFTQNLPFGAVRARPARLKWLDLHNLVGIATGLWALVVGATGLMNTLEGTLFGIWQNQELPALLASGTADKPAGSPASIDAAVATARAALPEMRPASIGLSGTRYATPRHHLVWMHGNNRLTKRLFTPVLVDATSGALRLAKPLPWYLRALELSRPLHFGDYGGMPLKVVWAVFDLSLIFLLSSGVYLWAAKWRAFSRTAPRMPERAMHS